MVFKIVTQIYKTMKCVLSFVILLSYSAQAFVNNQIYSQIVTNKAVVIVSAKAWKDATEELGKKKQKNNPKVPPIKTVKPAATKSNNAWKNAVEMPDESEKMSKKSQQQSGAAAVFLAACAFDLFVTHQGVGPWDPNYVL